MRLAYLVGTYPAVSHTFIAREVDGLRRRGAEVQTFSVRRPGPDQLLSEEDRRRAAETPSIQPPDWPGLVRAHGRALRRAPAAWCRALRLAVRLSPGGARATLWQVFYFAEAIVVWDWCRQRRIGHLHAHFADSGSWIAMLAAAYGGTSLTFSFTMHGPTEFDDVTRYRLAEKVERAQLVVCISNFCRSQLMKVSSPASWPKLHIAHCGVDTLTYRPPEPSAGGDHPIAGGDATLRVLCVGRLVAAMGQHLLIAAVARLRSRGLSVTVEMVGDGVQRDALTLAARQAGVAERLEFLGALSADSVRDRLARCDVFCLPSLAEGVPVVLMEAMAMEVPVLTTRIMGIPELVEDGRSGLLVTPGQVEELADGLERLGRDPDLRRRLGVAGRQKVCADFNLEREVDRLAVLFAAVAG